MRTGKIGEILVEKDANVVRDLLRRSGVFSVMLLGGPGCGKTRLIDETIVRLAPVMEIGMISCDDAPQRDAGRVWRQTASVTCVSAGDSRLPDAARIRAAVDQLDLGRLNLLFIEYVSTLAIPASLDLGQDATVALFSVAAGDDKPAKHPAVVRAADVVVLNKTDLLAAVPFDLPRFRTDVRRLNPSVGIFELSAFRGNGMEAWIDWVRRNVATETDAASHWFG
jgi:hydrogenase nickel incorporation protein HypB